MEKTKFFQDTDKKGILYAMNESEGFAPSALSLMEPNTVEAATEKHIPVLSFIGDEMIVRVGEAPHPMLSEHYIEWIFVRTQNGGMFRKLRPGDAPEVRFELHEDKVVSVFAYCNLHGLWEADMNSYKFPQTACSMEFPEGCID